MSRTLPSGFLTALTSSTSAIEPFYCVDLLFDDPDKLYFWTGVGTKQVGGITYVGAGDLMVLSETEEVNDLSVRGISITMSGLNTTIVTRALETPYQNRVAKVKFGIEGQSDLIEIFSGFMDTMFISDGPEHAVITLNLEHKLVGLERNTVRRYTHESHIDRYAGDTFFSFVQDLQDKTIPWGRDDE